MSRPRTEKTEQAKRLTEAREGAGFDTAAAAAAAMGIPTPTYVHHENGTSGLSRAGERYARFFHVNLEWLLTGRGPMKSRQRVYSGIPVDGIVGAGARVSVIDEASRHKIPDEISLPDDGTLGALIVEGNSHYPVFSDGEIILYDRRPMLPADLVGHLAVVQLYDGLRLLKTLRRGRTDQTFNLESANAPTEESVKVIAAYRYVGALASS